MKTIAFHMQGYRDLPADFNKRYDSIWVTPPNDELCDPETVGKYFRWNIAELKLADELGFDFFQSEIAGETHDLGDERASEATPAELRQH